MKINQTYVRLSVSFRSFLCLIGIVCPEMINFKLELMLKREGHRRQKGGEVGGRGYCLTVLHYLICVGVCVCVCVQCGASVVLIFRFGMRVTLCFLLHVRPDMLYLLLLLLLLLTYPGPHTCPPLSSSLCRVFCNGFHAGRLARPA